MFEESIVENGFYGGEKELSNSSFDKVDPAKPPSLTWQRKLNREQITLPSFSLTWKEILSDVEVALEAVTEVDFSAFNYSLELVKIN